MARDARLRLAQNLGKVGHRQFGLGEERQDTQPGTLPGRLQGGIQRGESQIGPLRHHKLTKAGVKSCPRTYKDIFIRLNH
jgi:hypothetical protein